MYNYVGDIDRVEGFTLVTDSQEVEHLKDTLNPTDAWCAWRVVCDAFFVEVVDGDYGRVYGFIGTVPEEDKQLFRIQ